MRHRKGPLRCRLRDLRRERHHVAVFAVIVVLFVWNAIPVVVVALGSALALYFTGVTTLS
jgi:hypothetical protein